MFYEKHRRPAGSCGRRDGRVKPRQDAAGAYSRTIAGGVASEDLLLKKLVSRIPERVRFPEAHARLRGNAETKPSHAGHGPHRTMGVTAGRASRLGRSETPRGWAEWPRMSGE